MKAKPKPRVRIGFSNLTPGEAVRLTFVAVAALLLVAPASGASESRTRALLSERSTLTLASLYSEYQRIMTASGHDLEIRVTVRDTFLASEFGRIRLRDVATTAPAWRLFASRSSHSDASGSELDCTYLLRRDETLEGVPAEVMSFAGTIEQALEVHSRENLGLEGRDFVGASTAEVHIRLDAFAQEYSVLLFWIGDAASIPVDFRIDDMVLPDLMVVQGEACPLSSQWELLRRSTVKLERARLAQDRTGEESVEAVCVESSKEYTYPRSVNYNNLGHSSGEHRGAGKLNYTCACQANCTSYGNDAWVETTCTDSGSIGGLWTHNARMSQMIQSSVVHNALTAGARPMGTVGCFIQKCPWPLGCGTGGTVSFSVGVFSITASYSGPNELWDGQVQFSVECGACDEALPLALRGGRPGYGPFNLNPDPGGMGYLARETVFYCYPMFSYSPLDCQGTPTPCLIETCTVIN